MYVVRWASSAEKRSAAALALGRGHSVAETRVSVAKAFQYPINPAAVPRTEVGPAEAPAAPLAVAVSVEVRPAAVLAEGTRAPGRRAVVEVSPAVATPVEEAAFPAVVVAAVATRVAAVAAPAAVAEVVVDTTDLILVWVS